MRARDNSVGTNLAVGVWRIDDLVCFSRYIANFVISFKLVFLSSVLVKE